MAMGKADQIRKVGAQALGTRLRRLSEQIDRDAAQCYKRFGVRFEPRWFGTIDQLRMNGGMSVSELAEALGITHVSVSQTRKSLEDQGLIASAPDPQDGRRAVLSLTDAGQALIRELTPLWDAMMAASIELDEEAMGIAKALGQLDDALERRSLFDRVGDRLSG